MSATMPEPTGPLVGLRVLELGSIIAGPFCGRLFADYGADVIKIEPPGAGDPLRAWSLVTDHGSLWSMVQSRNKRCAVADLRTADGQQFAAELAASCDVLIENFRPGRLESWGLGYEDLAERNPGLVMIRISGYGQTGPYSGRPGFGNVAESMGGIRHVTGYEDGPPLRVGLSLGDGVAALYAVIGGLAALQERASSGRGQVVDVALTESVFSLLEGILPEYGYDGRVRGRSGNLLNGAAPSNVYRTRDDRWLAIGANSDSIFRRLADAMGDGALAENPRFATNQGRRDHVAEIDEAIARWVAARDLTEAWRLMDEADVPSGPVNSIADIVADPQYQDRGMIVEFPDERVGSVLMPGVVPRFTRTPGAVRWAGPPVGAHDEELRRETMPEPARDAAG